ncbi:LysE family translocator [Corynebacterium alimapuense]|nr:LysE family transporter [Corynebacterium alimapuense]
MDTTTLLSFWAVSLLLIITPGPDWAFVTGFAFRRRPLTYPLAGIALGYLGLTVVVAAGLGALVSKHPALLTGVTVLGVLVLLRIGWSMLSAARRGPVTVEVPETREPEANGGAVALKTRPVVEKRSAIVLKGAAVSGLNPKGMMLFIALLPQFVVPTAQLPISAQMIAMGLVFIASATTFYALLGMFAGRVLAGSERASRLLTGVAGAAMMAVAGAMLVQHFII